MERIIVGINGSTAARAALRWAIREAVSRGAVIEAVHAWSVPDMGTDPLERALADPAALASLADGEARSVVAEADTRGLVAPVGVTVVCGRLDEALLAAADGADLLVVGASQLSPDGTVETGALGGRLVRDAPCPVVVVPTAVGVPVTAEALPG